MYNIEDVERISIEGGTFKLNEANIPLPNILTIHPTNKCNHKCTWCLFQHGSEEINIENTIDLIKYLTNITKIQEIVLSGGGEPLLHKNISKLIKLLDNYNYIHRRLYTNGEHLDKYADMIVNSFDYIRVSLDAGSDKYYSKLHGVKLGTFSKIINNIKQLSFLNKSAKIYVSFVVDQNNIMEAKKLVKVVKENNIKGIVFKSVINRKDATRMNLTNLLDLSYEKNIDIIIREEKHKAHNYTPPPIELVSLNFVLNSDNYIYPCCHLTEKKFRISYVHINDFILNYAKQNHINILNYYSENFHSCRIHDLWNKKIYKSN